MELVLSEKFCAMSEKDIMLVEGGDFVGNVVDGITGIWDSWCNMWYEAGKHVYDWTH